MRRILNRSLKLYTITFTVIMIWQLLSTNAANTDEYFSTDYYMRHL